MVAVAVAAPAPGDGGGDDRRSRLFRDYWIKYDTSERVLSKLEYLFALPRGGRMPNLVIAGLTNNGKTSLLQRFMSNHRVLRDPSAEADLVEILYVEVPPNPTEAEIYEQIIHAIHGPIRVSARTPEKRRQALTLLSNVGVRVLIFDEIQHILNANSTTRTILLDTVKYIGNMTQIPIVAAGTYEALNVFNRHTQLANRFEVMKLSKWSMGEEYLRLLAGLETILPLKRPSNLAGERLATKILSLTEGTIGEIIALVRAAALKAIESGRECIDESTLAMCGYTVPSARPSR
ncbi:MAG TPA: TniB family NTP-binding protein [Candidatus Baltobacteraceae bacterium]|jgi:hypothetical protein